MTLDLYSRYAFGWMPAHRESAALSKPMALLLSDLGVAKSHSSPHVSNDNPFSESQFKTMQYRPDFPDRFGGIEHGRAHCGAFFGQWRPAMPSSAPRSRPGPSASRQGGRRLAWYLAKSCSSRQACGAVDDQ